MGKKRRNLETGIVILDGSNLAFKSAGGWWRVMSRDGDTITLDGGDDRRMFFTRSDETIEESAQRLHELTGWTYRQGRG